LEETHLPARAIPQDADAEARDDLAEELQRNVRRALDPARRLDQGQREAVVRRERRALDKLEVRTVQREAPAPLADAVDGTAEQPRHELDVQQAPTAGGHEGEDGVAAHAAHTDRVAGRRREREAGDEREPDDEGRAARHHRTRSARCMSRLSSFSFKSARLSWSFLPRASPMRTFARPCLK
jgi:hypothetical protein